MLAVPTLAQVGAGYNLSILLISMGGVEERVGWPPFCGHREWEGGELTWHTNVGYRYTTPKG
jgi:hypothetical protein